MVGGTVTEVKTQVDSIWIDVQDNTYKTDFAAVYVERNTDSEQIAVGDQVWWQGRLLMWTPADKSRVDVQIQRLSASGVGVPSNYFD